MYSHEDNIRLNRIVSIVHVNGCDLSSKYLLKLIRKRCRAYCGARLIDDAAPLDLAEVDAMFLIAYIHYHGAASHLSTMAVARRKRDLRDYLDGKAEPALPRYVTSILDYKCDTVLIPHAARAHYLKASIQADHAYSAKRQAQFKSRMIVPKKHGNGGTVLT